MARALSGNSAMMKVSSAVSPPPVNNNRVRLIPFVVVTDDQQGSSVQGHFPRSDIYQGVHVVQLGLDCKLNTKIGLDTTTTTTHPPTTNF